MPDPKPGMNMRTDRRVLVEDSRGTMREFVVAEHAICLTNQLARASRHGGVKPIAMEDVSITATEVLGRFYENACNPDGLTLILNERPMSTTAG